MAITEIQRARAALAAAEQAHNQARAKDQECRALLAEVQSRPPATDLRTQVAHASERLGVEAARDAIQREVNETSALVNQRRRELTLTEDRAREAWANLAVRQGQLDERRAAWAHGQKVRQVLEPLLTDDLYRVLPDLSRQAQHLSDSCSGLIFDVQRYEEEVRQLQREADRWGEP